MEDVMCKCASCGHEAMCAVDSACSECGGEMKAMEEAGEAAEGMGGADMAADEKAGDDMPMDGGAQQ